MESNGLPDVALRPVTEDDEPFLWHWMHGTPDPEWKRWDAPYFHAADGPAPDRSRFQTAHARRVASGNSRIVQVDRTPAGLVTRHEEDPTGSGWWELGILLFDPAVWGRGIGTRALDLWLEDTFAATDAHLVTLTTWSGNTRMTAAAHRAGFREVARIPEARRWEGRQWDSVRLAVLRRERCTTPAAPPRDGVAYHEGRLPAPGPLRDLYDSVGWSAYTDAMPALEAGLVGSAHVVTAWEGDVLVGLARIVSDGHTIAYLQDVLVRPSHHRRGIASELLRRAFAPFAQVRQHVLLTDAEPGQRAFYESVGFTEVHELAHGGGRAFVRFQR
ncbi:GNAT family N-acetyltransferase [Micrococcus sp.]|uniref:GNAT family N-acetyltransferase n=1 Tax=Micrococcus sp. TaxID=1271 RepID=UPI002A90B64E|nr:GNAT family N-acetyltransferase [Micrococcus sp.]MDY6054960.1 GNAT family N-acetyltransferase [Micrococcus sp.]